MSTTTSKGSKGKGKAAPLLGAQETPTGASSECESLQAATGPRSVTPLRPPTRRVWRSYLLTGALALLTLFFGTVLGIVLLADSYAAPALRNINQALSHSGREGNRFWKEAVVLRGPDAVDVVSIDRTGDDLGVNMSISMRVAVDTDFIMGFRAEGFEDDTWWTKKWKAVGRWGVRQLGSTTVVVHDVIIFPPSSSAPLLTFTPLSPIAIPLSPGLSARDHSNPPPSMTPISIPLLIRPSQNASLLLHFAEQSWAQGFVTVRVHVSSLLIHGGHELRGPSNWWQLERWRNWLKARKDDVTLDVKLPIPPLHIPSHPPSKPGSGLPAISDLLTLEAFSIISAPSPTNPPRPFPSSTMQSPQSLDASRQNNNNAFVLRDQSAFSHQKGSSPPNDLASPQTQEAWNILIVARASLAHPFSTFAPKLEHGVKPFPFIVSLPIPPLHNASALALTPNASALALTPNASHDEEQSHGLIPVAKVYASPVFNKTHIQIPLSGYVLPFSKPRSSHLPGAISSFVSSYLSYKPSSISIHSPLYPSLVVQALFPPPPQRLELLRNVSIENMRIHPGLGSIFIPNQDRNSVSVSPSVTEGSDLRMFEILASATVHALVVLPPGMSIDISVRRVWVDCFVFDGEVPSEDTFLESDRISNRGIFDATVEPEGPAVPEPRPLPKPLPPRAFARLTPKNWLNASSTSVPPSGHGHQANQYGENKPGTNVYVTAEIVDVPLEVLPAREGELSKFVSKVVFSSEPAVAGIRGVAAVGISVPGLTSRSGPQVEGSELILTGLPFEGNVKVGGRKS